MYRDTMALRSNPFGPALPPEEGDQGGVRYVANLDRQPLRLDQCRRLRPLFCPTILDLEDHIERFRNLMVGLDYEFGESGVRSAESLFVLIRGALGSGKTTLGAWMIAELASVPGPPLEIFQESGSTDAALNNLKTKVYTVSAGRHVAALIENVTSETLNTAIAQFEHLEDWPRLYVVTTHNLKLLDADDRTLGGTARIEVFTLRALTSADANAYVEHRLPQFRDPERPEILQKSPIFPFTPGLAGRYVQRKANAGAALPVVLRQLNTHFRGKLSDHATQLKKQPGLVAVGEVEAESLDRYLLPDV